MIDVRTSVFIWCVLALLLLNSTIPHSTAGEDGSPITLLGVVYASEAPYDKPLVVDVTLAHNRTMIPSAMIYYAYLANGTTAFGGWRIARPESFTSDPAAGVTVYNFSLPYSAYKETFQHGARIVFYVEASDLEGNSFLSARPDDRWNPFVQDDKFVVDITDPDPPAIGEPGQSPLMPSPDAPVKISVPVSDIGSGVKDVLLTYSAGDLPPSTVAMNQTDPDTYEAQIPPFDAGTKVTFFVRAIDNAGNRICSPITSYQVSAPPEATLESNRLLLSGIVVAIAVFAVLGIWAMRKRLRGVSQPAPREAKHPKAMTALLALVVLLAAWLYYLLLPRGAALLGLVLAAALILGWGLIDPRVSILIPLKRGFDQMPPTSIVAEGYILGFAIALSLSTGYLLRLYSTATLYALAVMLAPYVLFLILLGIILQLAWPYLKEIDISIEIEPIDRKPETDAEK